MRRLFSGLALAAALSVAAPSLAAVAVPGVQDPDGVEAVPLVVVEDEATRKQALAARYLELTVTEAMSKVMGAFIDEQMKAMTEASPEEVAWVRATLPGMTLEMAEIMVERLTPSYAEALSLTELEALVAFFETPMGRSISRDIAEVSLAQEAIIYEVMEEMMVEYEEKYCAAFDCVELGLAPTVGKDSYRH